MSEKNYGELPIADHAKLINDEYAHILNNERSNFAKALTVGEMLIALRPRIAPEHGDWQTKLKVYCPKISYETATLYMRLAENREKIEKEAAVKSVSVTDLT